MGLSVNTNVSSLTAQRNVAASTNRLNTSLERLSTGLKINKSADNAAGLVISETQRAQISGLESAIANVDRAVNVIQTADSGLAEINSLLINMRQLAVDSANNGAQDADSIAANTAEFDNLAATITSISDNTKFGESINLLDGTFATKTFQIGAFSGETADVDIDDVDAAALGVAAGDVDLSTAALAATAIDDIDTAIGTITTLRGTLGAQQKNTFQATQSSLRSQLQNLQEAESSLRDTDYQAEITKFTNEQIRSQAASTVLGLANQSAQSVLSLLRG